MPLIARILKKKLKIRTKKIFFTIFTMLILFLGVFYLIYIKMSLHVTVPLRTLISPTTQNNLKLMGVLTSS